MSQLLTRRFTFLLSFICALTIGNLYVAQPLLEAIASDFLVSPSSVGLVATLAQLGYGAGVLLIVPLGDMSERRALMLWLLALVGLSLLGGALAPNVGLLMVASLAIGFTTVVPQIIMPYASALAEPSRRASILGTIQGGLLVGILVARTVSGFIAKFFGWRGAYFAAAGLTVMVFIGVRAKFPRQELSLRVRYRDLLFSMFTLFRRHAVLRRVSFSGAMNFAVFSAFWTSLAFLLEKSFGLGPATAGLFGLVGVVGALIASVAGRIVDRKGARYVQFASLGVTAASFVIYALAEHSLAMLVIGVIVMDAGAQANHISSQADVFTLDASAGSRLNGLYMFIRFTGGAIGSLLGAWSWNHYGWNGVVVLCLALSALAYLPLLGLPRALPSDALR